MRGGLKNESESRGNAASELPDATAELADVADTCACELAAEKRCAE